MRQLICLSLVAFSSLFQIAVQAEENFTETYDFGTSEPGACEKECKRCKGKLDLAPTFLKVNLIESGKTIDTHHMTGVRGGLDYFLWKALLFRGTGIAAWGDAKFQAYTAGIGACLPYKKFYFTPTVGVTYSRYSSDVDFPGLGLFDLKQTFHSFGPYTGLDIQWCLTDKWRVGAGVQYSWSRTRTKIKPIFSGKDRSQGPTWSMLIERDLNSKWSLNVGAAYNRSLNHEKHGIKGQGIKIGLTYWL